eukprot:3544516-Karenia_brevis.AAC.1
MMLASRIDEQLLNHQPVDQAGFRPMFSCDDHLFTTSIIQERARDYQLDIWMAAVDYRKAFDSIHHSAIWTALETQD